MTTLGVVPVIPPGRAQLTVDDLAPGDHDIVAHYSGDASCAAVGPRCGDVVCTIGPVEVARATIGPDDTAECTVPAMACGQHAIVASYTGDDLASPSSTVTTPVVKRSMTTMTVTAVEGPVPGSADHDGGSRDGRVRDHV